MLKALSVLVFSSCAIAWVLASIFQPDASWIFGILFILQYIFTIHVLAKQWHEERVQIIIEGLKDDYLNIHNGDELVTCGEKIKIVDLIAKTSNSRVYKVIRCKNDSVVALKVLDSTYTNVVQSKQQLDAFVNEGLMIRLQHPNILKMHKSGFVESRTIDIHDGEFPIPCHLLEYVNGSTLDDLKNTYSFSQKMTFVADMAVAIDYLHRLNVVHGDIKPNNVFFNDNNLLLGDFGSTKWPAEFNPFRTAQTLSTEKYLAPELKKYWNKEKKLPINHATDIYAFGVSLNEVFGISGSGEVADMCCRHCTKLAKKSLEQLINCMTDANPFKRPNAERISHELKQIMNQLV